ncbi:MAG: J domain-containing protein [Treponema sp.]|nr:J domain-containing protein [Treponema sp.]
MGIFERLGTVINSYLSDFGRETGSRLRSPNININRGDPDLDAAFEELNDYLNRKEPHFKPTEQKTESAGIKLPPQELRCDFELLGVPFSADDETCKAAYKKLLKVHHPDRHAKHDGNYKKATEKSSKINAAWDRIEKWRRTEGK